MNAPSDKTRAAWAKLLGDRPYSLVRRDTVRVGDTVYSSHWGEVVVTAARQHGTEGQTTELRFKTPERAPYPWGERYDSASHIPLLRGAVHPTFPGHEGATALAQEMGEAYQDGVDPMAFAAKHVEVTRQRFAEAILMAAVLFSGDHPGGTWSEAARHAHNYLTRHAYRDGEL